MTICITTATTDQPALLDSRFGRSPYFTFVDTETGTVAIEKNELAAGASGVGAQVAQLMADRGATAVITGQVGPSAFAVLEAAGVTAYTTKAESVAEALDLYKEGKLEAAGAATGPAHHGGGRGR